MPKCFVFYFFFYLTNDLLLVCFVRYTINNVFKCNHILYRDPVLHYALYVLFALHSAPC